MLCNFGFLNHTVYFPEFSVKQETKNKGNFLYKNLKSMVSIKLGFLVTII